MLKFVHHNAMDIRFDHIAKTYGRQSALDDVSFSLNSGEIIGLIGPNGAGKSTLIKILVGLISADRGSMILDGKSGDPTSIQYKSRIGYLPENNPLPQEMYVKEYLNHIASIYRPLNFDLLDILERTGLSEAAHQKIDALSKGYKQRLGLAAAILHHPDLLVLDEPMTGLDPNQIQDIRALIKSMSAKTTVLLSTHILQDISAICDHIIVLNRGKVIKDLSAKALIEVKETASLEDLFTQWTKS
ncbi:MAG: ABC transporter ATP-binding protein [Flavobacteriaceae bacterium]